MGSEWIIVKVCVLVVGGFELNCEWLWEVWGENVCGEWFVDNFLICGMCFNQGVLFKFMMDVGVDIIGDLF